MFENYENKTFHLDFWENCQNGTTTINNKYLFEAFEFEGKWYDSLEDVYHVGTAKTFDNARSFLNATNPVNLKKKYPNDKQFPLDYFIEFIDPKTLKRISFMITYEINPFGTGNMGGQKNCCRLIMYKSKALAAKKGHSGDYSYAFTVNSFADVKKVKADPSMVFIWAMSPVKNPDKLRASTVFNNLKASEIYNEMLTAVGKLNAAGYIVVENDSLDDTMEKILNGKR